VAKVEMYATGACPYCIRAKMLLEDKGVDFSEYRIDLDSRLRPEMIQRSQRTSVPQIFINGQHIGGFDDMYALDRAAKLDPLLNQE
jgi:glutaredoxin 3